MRIFYYFSELNTPMYQWQRSNHIDELQRGGHEVITFNPLEYSSLDEANEKAIVELDKVGKIDMFLACDSQDFIYQETVRRVSERGIPSCLICWDNLELPYKQKKIAPLFDVVWLTSWETQYLFEKWGCKKIIFQPYAANPFRYKAYLDLEQIDAVGFIGSPYGSRTNTLNELLNNGINCSLYSDSYFNKGYNTSVGGKKKLDVRDIVIKASRYLRFPIGRRVLYSTILNKLKRSSGLDTESEYAHLHRSISDEDMCKLYSEFALSLNISSLRDTYILKHPIPKIHLRAFEIPMSGGLQFTSYNKEIASYFEEGKEIVLYHSKEEMIDKAKYYLDPKHENVVRAMKIAARKRAERDHTWTKRFNVVFEALNLAY